MTAPRVWVTGAAGMLGRAVCAELEAAAVAVIRSDQELPIQDQEAVEAQLRASAVSHIINCAAYTRVDDAEDHVEAATTVNELGPAVLAGAAAAHGATLVHFSTDYVFDGDGSRPYDENDACAPLGAYAQSKRAGEQRVLTTLDAGGHMPAFVIRTSWLFGEAGASFPATMLRLFAAKPELRVVDDQHGRPTYTADLAAATLELLRLSAATSARRSATPGIYHFANSGETTWHGFACAILDAARRLGFPVKTEHIHGIPSADYPTRARRPKYSVLATTKIEAELSGAPRPWSAALEQFLRNERALQA